MCGICLCIMMCITLSATYVGVAARGFFFGLNFKFKTLCYRLKEAGICDFVEQTPFRGCFTCHTNTKCQSTDVLSHRWRWVTVKSFLTYKLPRPKPLGSIYTEDLAWLDNLFVSVVSLMFQPKRFNFFFTYNFYCDIHAWCVRPNMFILWIMYNFYPKIFRKSVFFFFCLFQFFFSVLQCEWHRGLFCHLQLLF